MFVWTNSPWSRKRKEHKSGTHSTRKRFETARVSVGRRGEGVKKERERSEKDRVIEKGIRQRQQNETTNGVGGGQVWNTTGHESACATALPRSNMKTTMPRKCIFAKGVWGTGEGRDKGVEKKEGLTWGTAAAAVAETPGFWRKKKGGGVDLMNYQHNWRGGNKNWRKRLKVCITFSLIRIWSERWTHIMQTI